MSGFAASWLALREPYDARARNPAVLEAMAAALGDSPAISIVDLACGRGSTLRAISAHLPARQDWRLVDNNLALLSEATSLPRPPCVKVTTVPLDLASDLRRALDGPVDLVTASALLDLVSQKWLEQFAEQAAERRLPVYIALSYNGCAHFEPADPNDAAILAALNRHQLGDKGFGPALGPKAAAFAVERLAAEGHALTQGPSDWLLAPADHEIQLEILAGWAQAARETGTVPHADIDAWLKARRAAVAAGRSSLRVGHVDFFARAMGMR
jgi:hypothetical protein